MTIERTYRCDLCRDVYTTPDCNQGLLIGILWAHHVTEKRQVFRRERDWRSCEHHICHNCIKDTVALRAEIAGVTQ